MAKEIRATIVLNDGEQIRLKLDPSAAPISVGNFTALAKDKYYDGLCFHRVIDGFMIQGGGLRDEGGRLFPAPELKPIKGEFASNGVKNPIKHKTGVISMARTMIKDSATSQFFICVADTPFLDGEYAAFGTCADPQSVAVAKKIAKVATHTIPQGYADVPVEPIVIKTVIVEE